MFKNVTIVFAITLLFSNAYASSIMCSVKIDDLHYKSKSEINFNFKLSEISNRKTKTITIPKSEMNLIVSQKENQYLISLTQVQNQRDSKSDLAVASTLVKDDSYLEFKIQSKKYIIECLRLFSTSPYGFYNEDDDSEDYPI